MRSLTIDIFKFSELNETAQALALTEVRENILNLDDFDYSEYKASLSAFADDIGFTVDDWSYGLDCCSVDIDTNDLIAEDFNGAGELSGVRAYKWIVNNVKGLQPGPRVYCGERETIRHGFKQFERIVKRVSGVYLEADCCNYTGVFCDETLLKPFREFLKNPTDDIQLIDLVNAAIDGYCETMLGDLEHQESDEYVREYIDANGETLEFLCNGKIYE